MTNASFQRSPVCTSRRKATNALKSIADEHQLCHALLGLEKVRNGKACFASQVKQCPGACVGRESAASHTARMLAALENLRMQRWPYAGPIGIREGEAWHVVSNWSYFGTAENEAAILNLIAHGQPHFDRDVYQILHRKLDGMGNRVRQFY